MTAEISNAVETIKQPFLSKVESILEAEEEYDAHAR